MIKIKDILKERWDSREVGLVNMKTKKQFMTCAQELSDDLQDEGYSRNDVIRYLQREIEKIR